MNLTKEQIAAHQVHYNTYKSLPDEVMNELFVAANTVANLIPVTNVTVTAGPVVVATPEVISTGVKPAKGKQKQ